ncbi:MAG: DUF2948 family protein [Boseongicola sp.]|nr:DUF2948 family protein [Boseongicola sp.]MDD9977560.1 DUF2948 family protein [Boseongicola sp.]
MVEDAKFADGGETPLRLQALDAEDLQVVSALAQDAVFPGNEMTWDRKGRRFAVLLNRFRWEDREKAERQHRELERVQSVLVVEDVLHVASQGIDRADADTVLSLLSLEFSEGEEGGGDVLLTLAGDGAIRLTVEALEVRLGDVTRPYRAPSGTAPHHPE